MATYASKLDALKACLEIWLFLRKHPNLTTKREAYSAMDISPRRDLHLCPACEYTSERGRYVESCKECPVWGYKSDGVMEVNFMCERGKSPYKRWINSCSDEGRKSSANGMVRLIRKRMREHA